MSGYRRISPEKIASIREMFIGGEQVMNRIAEALDVNVGSVCHYLRDIRPPDPAHHYKGRNHPRMVSARITA